MFQYLLEFVKLVYLRQRAMQYMEFEPSEEEISDSAYL